MKELNNNDKSDFMICNSASYNIYNWKKTNDLMFLKQMSSPQKTDFINTTKEDSLKRGNSRDCEYTPRLMTRGSNNIEINHIDKRMDQDVTNPFYMNLTKQNSPPNKSCK